MSGSELRDWVLVHVHIFCMRCIWLCSCTYACVPCCMHVCVCVWYLGSGSWARPSGSRRSRRSEACNYWSPRGLLWGRYGSSDACCSCADAQEYFLFFIFLFEREMQRACALPLKCDCAFAGLFLASTAWGLGGSHSPTGDMDRPRLTVQRPLKASEAPLRAGRKQFWLRNISSDPPSCLELECNFTESYKYLRP